MLDFSETINMLMKNNEKILLNKIETEDREE